MRQQYLTSCHLRAVTALVIVFVLRLPPKDSPIKNQGILTVLWGLDPLGFMTFVPSIICLLLALEVCSTKGRLEHLLCS